TLVRSAALLETDALAVLEIDSGNDEHLVTCLNREFIASIYYESSKRSNHSVPRQKVAQQLQAAVLTLLRMKLDGKDVALAESRGELDAVARTACRLRLVGKCHVITVDEVETAAIVRSEERRVGRGW